MGSSLVWIIVPKWLISILVRKTVLFVRRLTGASARIASVFLTFFMGDSLHIGKMIRKRLEADGHTVVWFASQIHCSRVNAYKIFSKRSIDTELLIRICKALDHDFFRDISNSLYSIQGVTD